MKLLCLHCDFLEFVAQKKAIKNIDEIAPDQLMDGRLEDCLAVLFSIEQGDSPKSADELVNQIRNIAKDVKATRLVLYPYAHLSNNLASPPVAIDLIEKARLDLEKDFEVLSAPFGYYKQFSLQVKGHPLSELSREIRVDTTVSSHEAPLSDAERAKLLRKMEKIKMQAPRGKNDLKSNVEIGRDLDLYIVNEVIGQGLPLFTPKGTAIKREIERFIVDEELARGYEHTSTPVMARSDLYRISGHWQHYKDDMFTFCCGKDEFGLRPMTCPFQFALFKRKPRSAKDLPKRYAEIAQLFRNEKSGELRGLTRVRQMTLADAHILCTPDQLESEFREVIDLLKYVMKVFDIDVVYRFSRRDPKNAKGKYIDNDEAWERTEASMKAILDGLDINYIEALDEAAFYGPKLDLQFKDVYGKEDTIITVQIDFAGAHNFGLMYTDENGREQPVTIIHRSSTGTTERLMSYLLEKTQGNLPLWLSPVQVRVLSMHQDVVSYAQEVCEVLKQAGIRAEVDLSNESIGKKARNAITQKVYYLATIGAEEARNKQLAVRTRSEKEVVKLSTEEFISRIKEGIEKKL